MKRRTLLFVAFMIEGMIAGVIPMTAGCASRQKRSDVPAQAAAVDRSAATATAAAELSSKADPPAGDPPATAAPAAADTPAAVDPPPADPPAADPPAIASAASQASGDAPAAQPEVMGAASADADLGDAGIVGAQKPSGSVIGNAVRGTASFAKNVALAPFRFVAKVLRKTYTAEGLAKSQTIELNGKTVSIVDYNAEVNKSKKPLSLRKRVERAAETGYDYVEKTVFLPFQFVDSLVGAIFTPF